jgi:hypothetical protein
MLDLSAKRRGFLLSLAAASSAAATGTAAASGEAVAENPALLKLAASLQSITASYRTTCKVYDDFAEACRIATPLAPDEITVPGTAGRAVTDPKQAGYSEETIFGEDLRREGERFPRRIVTRSYDISTAIDRVRRDKRRAKREGDVAGFLAAEEEVRGLKVKLAVAEAYETAYREAREAAAAEKKRLSDLRHEVLIIFATHVGRTLNAEDFTVEGLLIKADALSEWGRIGAADRPFAGLLSRDWHVKIAHSVLRHAGKVGA